MDVITICVDESSAFLLCALRPLYSAPQRLSNSQHLRVNLSINEPAFYEQLLAAIRFTRCQHFCVQQPYGKPSGGKLKFTPDTHELYVKTRQNFHQICTRLRLSVAPGGVLYPQRLNVDSAF